MKSRTKTKNNTRKLASEYCKKAYMALNELYNILDREEECFDVSLSRFEGDTDDYHPVDLWLIEEDVEMYNKLYKSLCLKIKDNQNGND